MSEYNRRFQESGSVWPRRRVAGTLEEMARPSDEATTLRVRRAIEGDRTSASWLVERLSPALLAQAAWRLGPHLRRLYDPEDLVADAWMRLLPKLHELPPRDGRYTPVIFRYLSTAIVNRVNFLVKQRLRRGEASLPDDASSLSDPELSGVVTAAVRAERSQSIASALADLSPQDQEIVILRGIEQRENQTVAQLLSLTPAATAMRYHRALRRLRAQLPNSLFDEFPEGDDP